MNAESDISPYIRFNPFASWVVERDSLKFVDVNLKALQYYGYSRDEFLSLSIEDILPDIQATENADSISELLRGKDFEFPATCLFKKKSGECTRFEVHTQVLDMNGKTCLLAVCRKLGQMENQLCVEKIRLEQLDAISSITGIGYWKLNLKDNKLTWSDEIFDILGRDSSTFHMSLKHWQEVVHPDDRESFSSAIHNAIKGHEAHDFAYRVIWPDKSIKWIHQKGRLLTNSRGGLQALEGTAQDITEIKENELRLNELNTALRISEERFRFAQEIAPDGYTILHPVRDDKGAIIDFSWVYENQAIANINKTDPKEVIGKRLLDLFPSHQGTELFDAYVQVAESGQSKIFDDVYVGEILSEPTWLRLTLVSIGEDIAILTHNITERKLAEEALRKSEANLRTIFEIASLGIAQVNPANGNILFINKHYESITGYSVEELYKMSFVQLTHPDDREKDWELFSKAARGEQEYKNEKRYVRKDGTIIWVRIHLAFIRDENGKAIRTVAICENITERKESELRLSDLSDNLPGVIFQYVLNPDGSDALKSVSRGSHRLWAHSPEEVENDIDLVWNQIKAAGDYDKVKAGILEAVRTKSKWSARYRSVLPSGELQFHLGSGTPNYLMDGTVVFNSVILDVSNEAKNEEILSQASSMARIGSWEVDPIRGDVFWSDMTHQLHETDPATFQPNLEDGILFYREDFRELVRSHVNSSIETEMSFDFEAVIVTANNRERWVRAIGRSEIIGKQSKRILGSLQDIHTQKTNEIALEQSLKTLREYQLAVDQAVSLIMIDSESIIIEVNENFCSLSQYARSELIGAKHEIIPPELNAEQVLTNFSQRFVEGKVWRGEVCLKKKDGSKYWVNTTVVPLLDAHNSPYQYLVLRIDISYRKRAEEQINQAYEKLKKIAWTQSHVVRAPLARMLGIMNLIEKDFAKDEEICLWIRHLRHSADEMDQIVKRIVEETKSMI